MARGSRPPTRKEVRKLEAFEGKQRICTDGKHCRRRVCTFIHPADWVEVDANEREERILRNRAMELKGAVLDDMDVPKSAGGKRKSPRKESPRKKEEDDFLPESPKDSVAVMALQEKLATRKSEKEHQERIKREAEAVREETAAREREAKKNQQNALWQRVKELRLVEGVARDAVCAAGAGARRGAASGPLRRLCLHQAQLVMRLREDDKRRAREAQKRARQRAQELNALAAANEEESKLQAQEETPYRDLPAKFRLTSCKHLHPMKCRFYFNPDLYPEDCLRGERCAFAHSNGELKAWKTANYKLKESRRAEIELARTKGKSYGGIWSCATCTFENPPEVAVCGMCNASRPGEAAAPAFSDLLDQAPAPPSHTTVEWEAPLFSFDQDPAPLHLQPPLWAAPGMAPAPALPSASNPLTASALPSASNPLTLASFLATLKLERLLPIFEEEEVDMQSLLLMEDEHLVLMGFKVGIRVRLRAAIARFPRSEYPDFMYD